MVEECAKETRRHIPRRRVVDLCFPSYCTRLSRICSCVADHRVEAQRCFCVHRCHAARKASAMLCQRSRVMRLRAGLAVCVCVWTWSPVSTSRAHFQFVTDPLPVFTRTASIDTIRRDGHSTLPPCARSSNPRVHCLGLLAHQAELLQRQPGVPRGKRCTHTHACAHTPTTAPWAPLRTHELPCVPGLALPAPLYTHAHVCSPQHLCTLSANQV